MRIVHISDLHIRNFKYREEYKAAFEDLYRQIEELKPDLVINTGDTVHSKLAVSPELFDDVADHIRSVTNISPYWMVLGNHDLNLKNTARTDAISPIVRAIAGSTVHQVKLLEPGPHMYGTDTIFWNFDIRDKEHKFYPSIGELNIGLYHGSISGCVTDIGFVMDEAEAEVSKFHRMDYVLLGDIHKRQSFRDGHIQYPGSLIQQNYGEELVKGFLLWDIKSKTEFTVDFHPVKAPARFYTMEVPQNLDVTGLPIPSGSRVRAIVQGELTPSRRLELEKNIRDAYSPLEIITPDSSGDRLGMEAPDIDELVGSREKLSRDHLRERGVNDATADEVMKLFREYESAVDTDGSARGTTWQLKSMRWDNMMNFGEGNVLDLTKLSGLVGIFAPNASGKSSIFDIMLEGLFDKISKEVPRNIDLVNDNKDSGKMLIELESGGQPFLIERMIERIHYGQRKLVETKQWGKTLLDFSSVDESLNGTSRPETEREIRRIIGSFEDFALSTMVTQNPVFGLPGGGDILNCRETDRRKILFRFLDLDIYEKIAAAAKDDLKELMGKLKVDRDKLVTKIEDLKTKGEEYKLNIVSARDGVNTFEGLLAEIRTKLAGTEDVEKASANAKRLAQGEIALQNKRDFARATLAETENSISVLTKKLLDLQSQKPSSPTRSLADLVSVGQEIQTRLDRERSDLVRQRDLQRVGQRSLKLLDDIPCEGKFPTCRFIADATTFLTTEEVIKAAISKLSESTENDKEELAHLDEHHVAHRSVGEWERKVATVNLQISKSETTQVLHIHALQAADDELKHVQALHRDATNLLDASSLESVKLLRENEEVILAGIAVNSDQLEDSLKGLGAIQAAEVKALADLEEYDGLKVKARNQELLAELCGKNGLPYRILTLVLPAINSEISKILSGIVKFSVFFEDDPEEQTVSLFIRYGDYKSRPLSLGSGAEKFIASLAIRVALLSVSSLPKTDILIIDEGFGKLDPEHLEALQRMFEYLRDAFGTVFIVSHVDMMRDIVDHSVEITSHDGYAHVEVI